MTAILGADMLLIGSAAATAGAGVVAGTVVVAEAGVVLAAAGAAAAGVELIAVAGAGAGAAVEEEAVDLSDFLFPKLERRLINPDIDSRSVRGEVKKVERINAADPGRRLSLYPVCVLLLPHTPRDAFRWRSFGRLSTLLFCSPIVVRAPQALNPKFGSEPESQLQWY